jgi:hypothetical protein
VPSNNVPHPPGKHGAHSDAFCYARAGGDDYVYVVAYTCIIIHHSGPKGPAGPLLGN